MRSIVGMSFAAAFPLILASAVCTACRGQEPARPNVLLILADDHAYHALGAYGNGTVRTPRLDRLASEGALFTRAYTNSPICSASRQSLITGRYPHATCVTLLTTPLPAEEITLAAILGPAGYETAAIGKMHFNDTLSHGFELRIDQPDFHRRLKEHPPAPVPEGASVLGPWRPFRDPARVWLNASCLPFGAREEDMLGTFLASEAARFLRKEHRRPFFLVVSFYEPHSPFHFPLEYAGRQDPGKLVLPEVGPEDPPQIPLIFRDLTPAEKKGIVAASYTSAEFLDANVGRVLDALETAGLERDTLVIYGGDNGYNLGHHGRFEKHCFWEEAVRVPLLVRWPGHVAPGRRVDDLVEYVDVLPTILEATGVSPPPERHGKSLISLLTGIVDAPVTEAARGKLSAPHREHVVSLYYHNEEAMVCSRRWKLIYCTGRRARDDGYATDRPAPGRYRRLYDLEADPKETRDLSGRPEHAERIRQFEQVLLERFESTCRRELKAPQELPLEEKLDWYLVPPEARRQDELKSRPKGVAMEIVAHRGASSQAPENTLAAVRLAWEEGADAVEVDIHLTRDGRAVVIHDENTRRTTGVDALVAERSLEELEALDAGSWKDPLYRGEKIPTLEAVLEALPEGKRLLVEVKCGPAVVPHMRRILEAAWKAGTRREQVRIISFEPEVLRAAREAMPGLRTHLLVGWEREKDGDGRETGRWKPAVEDILQAARACRADGLGVGADGPLDEALAAKFREAGLELHVWTVNDAAVARRMAALGVASVTTDRPGPLRKELAR